MEYSGKTWLALPVGLGDHALGHDGNQKTGGQCIEFLNSIT